MCRFLLFALLAAFRTEAQEFPSDWSFVTLRTPHFEVIVNARQQELGVLYARKLEQAYDYLNPLFLDKPADRVPVVLADKTDITNGYATRLPYPHIFIYPVMPGPFDSLGESGDWVLELVAHEYTHILTFEAVSGVMDPLQSVFGNIISPNLLLPRWWKEGVAVEVETRLGLGGRSRSAYQDGLLRTLFDSGSLERFDIAQINEVLPSWPEGMRPYLFGALFWSEALAEKGPIIIDRLHQRHGGRVPYFIEQPARELLGADYPSFYRQALRNTERKIEEQREVLRSRPLTPVRPLRGDTEGRRRDVRYDSAPRISPDGKFLALVSVDSTARRSVRLFLRNPEGNFENAPEQRLRIVNEDNEQAPPTKDGPPSGSISRVSWFNHSPRLVHDKVDAVSRYERYSDLWVYDLSSDKSSRLTTALRAREPAVSPDDRFIVFVGLEGGRTYLGLWDLEKSEARRLWTGQWQDRISSPTFHDAETVIFAVRNDRGEEHLRRLRLNCLDCGEPEILLPQYPVARAPERTEEGLLFTSTMNGVHNLYLATPDLQTARPLTHVEGALFSSTIDPLNGDLYVSALTGEGPRAGRVAAADRWKGEALPVIGPLWSERYPRLEPPPMPMIDPEVEDYSPLGYLRPRYWLPLVAVSNVNNGLIVQIATSGFDPLKKHTYAATAAWDSGVHRGSGDLVYQNATGRHPWVLRGSQQSSYLVSAEEPLTNSSASASVLPDLFSWGQHWGAELGWRWIQTDYAGTVARRSGPSAGLSYVDYSRAGTEISPERGFSAYASTVSYLRGPRQLEYNQHLLGGNLFWSKGLPERHALSVRLHGVHTPESIGSIYGVSTSNFFFVQDAPGPSYVMRGYRIGHFFGKTLASTNLEYRFPLKEIRRGSGTDPFFLHRLHGAIFADGVALDGGAYNVERERFEAVTTSKNFWSVGAEARLELTAGYFLPINVVMGFAWPQNRAHSDGPGLITALQLGAFF